MKSGGFHEIWQISWNLADFMARWNSLDFMAMKSAGFHEIQRISCQGLLSGRPWKFSMYLYWMYPKWAKNTAFSGKPRTYTLHLYLYWISWMKKIQHSVVDHEIRRISCQGLIHYYAVYMCIGSYGKIQDLVVDHESLHFSTSAMKSGGFHDKIWRISWNQANFMKSGGFHGWSWKMQTWKCKFL